MRIYIRRFFLFFFAGAALLILTLFCGNQYTFANIEENFKDKLSFEINRSDYEALKNVLLSDKTSVYICFDDKLNAYTLRYSNDGMNYSNQVLLDRYYQDTIKLNTIQKLLSKLNLTYVDKNSDGVGLAKTEMLVYLYSEEKQSDIPISGNWYIKRIMAV